MDEKWFYTIVSIRLWPMIKMLIMVSFGNGRKNCLLHYCNTFLFLSRFYIWDQFHQIMAHCITEWHNAQGRDDSSYNYKVLQIQEESKYFWKPCFWNQKSLSKKEIVICIIYWFSHSDYSQHLQHNFYTSCLNWKCIAPIWKEDWNTRNTGGNGLKFLGIIPAAN